MTNGGGGSSASNKALYNRSHQKKRMAAMKEEAAAAANLGQTMASAFSIANMQGKNMAQIFADMGSRFADMIVQALAFKLIMAGLNAIPGVGSFLSLIGIGAHNGGEFVGTSSGVMKMAGGGSFMVPGGFPNDSFGPMFFETGEKVSVTPASQVNNNFSDRAMVNELQGIRSSIHSLTKITLQHREVISNLYLDSKLLATSVTQKQNEFERSNIKVNR